MFIIRFIFLIHSFTNTELMGWEIAWVESCDFLNPTFIKYVIPSEAFRLIRVNPYLNFVPKYSYFRYSHPIFSLHTSMAPSPQWRRFPLWGWRKTSPHQQKWAAWRLLVLMGGHWVDLWPEWNPPVPCTTRCSENKWNEDFILAMLVFFKGVHTLVRTHMKQLQVLHSSSTTTIRTGIPYFLE